MIRRVSYFCLFLLLCISTAVAQEIEGRPRIGLALSGGGAHGIAHLGVIKVMEEAGLRPDYISGVSMGSIIGGMYSIGYSADSLLSLLKSIDWEIILSNRIEENKVIFLEKENFYNSILYLPLSKNKIILPSGLINGQLIENTLNYYAWPAADINDFSKLPIPFTCIATDIISYNKIELKTGYLPDAIRASFSVPSIFTPLKIDTLLLLDGGLIRNFAASEVRSMGADIVIGSYAGFIAYKEEDLQSVSGILKQIALFRSLEDFKSQEYLVDVLIKPEVHDLPITGFENIDTLFRRGYDAALPYKEHFRKLSDSLNRIAEQKPLANILNKQSYVFKTIEVNGNNTYSDYQILGILNINPGEEVDRNKLGEGIELLYGKGWFEKVKYRVVPRNDSLILSIDCIEKPEAIFYGSVHYDDALLSGIKIGLSVNNFLTQRSVININSLISQYYRFKVDLTQFIDANQAFGLSTNFYADNTLIPMMDAGGDRGGTISREFIPGLTLNKRIGLNNMMSLNLNWENRNLILDYDSEALLKSFSYNYVSSTWDYKINTIDRKHFPDKGTIFNFSAGTSKLRSGTIKTDSSRIEYRDGDGELSTDRFYTLRGNIRHYFSPNKKVTFTFGGEALWISDSDTISEQNNYSFLGGVESVNKRSIPMTGFHSNEIHVKKVAGFRSDIDIEIIKDLHINLMADIFAIEEIKNNDGFSLLAGFGLGAGYMSVIGPVRIGIMYGNQKEENHFNNIKGYISIGYKF